ncbi:MAG: TonB-dependent receptor [Chitinophagales bacterium]|nr:TonB-dependent receptor [Chitinophagales bacterium]
MIRLVTFLLLLSGIVSQTAFAQSSSVLLGSVRDKNTAEPLIGATVSVQNTSVGATTDAEGNFRIGGLKPGSYNITASYLGYNPDTRFNVVLTVGNAAQLNFELEAAGTTLDEVVVARNRSTRVATTETPLSIQNLSVEEIKSNPGGNFDISRVVQALPGVGGTAGSVGGFRNDLIIRGGGPGENVYYLDGIEIPVINHFSTQGAAGGPTGILNVSFIEDVTLASSAFHARYDNTLSSVLQFKQRDGNPDGLQGNFRLSGTEMALTADGPMGKKTTFLASARRSYLQFLFQALDLPIRPNYWDFQYKITHKIDAKTTLSSIGVGAIDEFTFALPKEATPENLYVLSANPSINQWNYTQGFTLKRLVEDGYWNLSFSRNMFDNRLDQFRDNYDGKQTDESKRILGIQSQEIENKLRFDYNRFSGDWKWSYGAVAQYVKYNNDAFTVIRPEIRDSNDVLIQPGISSSFNTAIGFFRYGVFGQVNRSFLRDRLAVSFGLRADGNSFSDEGYRLDRTLSPRLSAAYQLAERWKVSASLGRYYKLPIYTALGYKDENGAYLNKSLPYTRTDHAVAGLEFIPTPTLRFTVEGFYKWYSDYAVSRRDGLSLANQGGGFGIIGNEALEGSGKGRAYGFEIFAQQKLSKNLFFTGSYTLFWSEFSGTDERFIASSWDNRHLLSLILGRKFKRNWEMGLKWRYQGGVPYTPFDEAASLRNYPTLGQGVLDYNRLNGQRLGSFSQFDFRIDKKWNFKRSTFDLFFDVQNAFVQKNPAYPQFTLQRNADNTGFATTDGQPLRADGSNAIPIILNNDDPSVVPTIGFIFEF